MTKQNETIQNLTKTVENMSVLIGVYRKALDEAAYEYASTVHTFSGCRERCPFYKCGGIDSCKGVTFDECKKVALERWWRNL